MSRLGLFYDSPARIPVWQYMLLQVLVLISLMLSVVAILAVYEFVPRERSTAGVTVTPETINSVRAMPQKVFGGARYSHVIAYDVLGVAACTNSMLPGIACDDDLYFVYVSIDEEYVLGRSYVFNGTAYGFSSDIVLHRLVGCIDASCDQLIFMGDNNDYVDPVVSRDDVMWRLVWQRHG